MQFEMAPIFEDVNIANDHNALAMDIARRVALRHHLVFMSHEKPYARINGSGKHCNWSMGTDRGENLLEPGRTPHQNLRFLAMLAACLKAVHDHAVALRYSIANANNDLRLGANEAPPAILSVFVGDLMSDIIEKIVSGKPGKDPEHFVLDMGVAKLPGLARDNTDRNRTSPFAFTGNKFEYRAVGSSANCAAPMAVLNAAMADSMRQMATRLKAKLDGGRPRDEAVLELLREVFIETAPVRFEGNGYSEEWKIEASRRGLPNIATTPAVIEAMRDPKHHGFLSAFGIFSERELGSRFNVDLERYIKQVTLEAETLIEMLTTQVVRRRSASWRSRPPCCRPWWADPPFDGWCRLAAWGGAGTTGGLALEVHGRRAGRGRAAGEAPATRPTARRGARALLAEHARPLMERSGSRPTWSKAGRRRALVVSQVPRDAFTRAAVRAGAGCTLPRPAPDDPPPFLWAAPDGSRRVARTDRFAPALGGRAHAGGESSPALHQGFEAQLVSPRARRPRGAFREPRARAARTALPSRYSKLPATCRARSLVLRYRQGAQGAIPHRPLTVGAAWYHGLWRSYFSHAAITHPANDAQRGDRHPRVRDDRGEDLSHRIGSGDPAAVARTSPSADDHRTAALQRRSHARAGVPRSHRARRSGRGSARPLAGGDPGRFVRRQRRGAGAASRTHPAAFLSGRHRAPGGRRERRLCLARRPRACRQPKWWSPAVAQHVRGYASRSSLPPPCSCATATFWGARAAVKLDGGDDSLPRGSEVVPAHAAGGSVPQVAAHSRAGPRFGGRRHRYAVFGGDGVRGGAAGANGGATASLGRWCRAGGVPRRAGGPVVASLAGRT
jgi:hypothetical protein